MFCYPNIYSKIHPLQKADLQYCCSALAFENLEKIPVKEFNFSVKVSSVGPTTVLKNELLHSLFFKIFDHDCRRTILENTFRWLFLERFLREKLLILKFRQNISYHIFSDKHRCHRKNALPSNYLPGNNNSPVFFSQEIVTPRSIYLLVKYHSLQEIWTPL